MKLLATWSEFVPGIHTLSTHGLVFACVQQTADGDYAVDFSGCNESMFAPSFDAATKMAEEKVLELAKFWGKAVG